MDGSATRLASPFITCYTQRLWLHMGERLSYYARPCISLRDGKCRWVGALTLHSCRDKDGEYENKEAGIGEICELIAISMGYADNQNQHEGALDEWDYRERLEIVRDMSSIMSCTSNGSLT